MEIKTFGTVTLILGDCNIFMKDLPDKAFDLGCVDPPYGINGKFRTYHSPNQSQKNSLSKFKNVDWDNFTPSSKYWNELKRMSINQIIFGGNYFIEFLFNTRCWIVWDKMTYIPTMSQIELAWTSFDENSRLIKINSNDENRIHPTQKPVALYEWLLKNYAKPGQTIIDTHAGSFSSAVAALKMGFTYTGIEIDSDYYRMGCERVEAVYEAITLGYAKTKLNKIQPTLF
ncbi:MAG: DNA methyltransferase [Lutibacter sp.]